ncbi:MAG TPA: TrbG/VirB9 family P-type conjugative transfer protein [Thermoanaerobaculia bacterium]|jgi:type IV secretion system protein VirB9
MFRRLKVVFFVVFSFASGLLPAHAGEAPAPRGTWTSVPYGTANPTLHCMPLGACIVALQEGETLEARFLSDTARWEIEPGTTGQGGRIPVLAIKPKECGITSNLFVTTDRRVYTFLLEAPACDPAQLSAGTLRFDQLRFTYPEEFARLWQEPAPPVALGVSIGARRVSELHFDYTWSGGRKAIEPKIVYDDGAKTYIVLKDEDQHREAPAVFIHGEHDSLEAVNFTPPPAGGATYTVDRVVSELVLVTGPSSSEKTVIHRKGH